MEKHWNKWLWFFPVQTRKFGVFYVVWRWLCSKSMEKHWKKWLWLFSVQTGKAGDSYVANQWKNIGKSGYGSFEAKWKNLAISMYQINGKTLEEVALAFSSPN